MDHQQTVNYLKALRKKSGLSQRDLGKLVGYRNPGPVFRHEQSKSVPPLPAALAYELIFRVPVAAIFVGMHEGIARDVEVKLKEIKAALENRSVRTRDENLTAQKLVWLNERQKEEAKR